MRGCLTVSLYRNTVPIAMGTYELISAVEAARRVRSGDLMLDVRTPGEFAAASVEGALLYPLQEFDLDKVREAVGGRGVCVMCAAGVRAVKAAEMMCAGGMSKVYVVEGGMRAWEASGLPIRRGKGGVISVERQTRLVMGVMVVVGGLLGYFLNTAWLWLAVFVGAGMIYSALTNWCGLGLLIARMPWNSRGCDGDGQGCCGGLKREEG